MGQLFISVPEGVTHSQEFSFDVQPLAEQLIDTPPPQSTISWAFPPKIIFC